MRNTLASAFAALGLIGGLGVPIYWWITYSGVYRWLAEVQLSWFDGYYAILTGVLSIAAGLIAFVPMTVMLAGVLRLPEAEPSTDNPQASAEPPPVVVLTPTQAAHAKARSNSIGCAVVLALLFVPILILGAYKLNLANQFGEKRMVELEQLEAELTADALASRWVEFEARPAWRETAGVKDKYKVTRYVPVRSVPERDALIALELPDAPPTGRRRWTGTLTEGAPGVIRSAFGERGTVRDPVWVLAVDSTPDDDRRIGWSMLEVGGGTIVIGLFVIGFLRRRWRRVDA